jgi:hypothetical protein
MESNTSKQEAQMQNGIKYQWIFTLLSIPKIGGLLATIIIVAPACVFSLLFISIVPIDNPDVPGGPVILITVILLSCMLIATWWWLHYLERKVNLAFFLPIPFINIRIKWILYPFMLPFFGIRKIYSALTNKQEINTEDSPPG